MSGALTQAEGCDSQSMREKIARIIHPEAWPDRLVKADEFAALGIRRAAGRAKADKVLTALTAHAPAQPLADVERALQAVWSAHSDMTMALAYHGSDDKLCKEHLLKALRELGAVRIPPSAPAALPQPSPEKDQVHEGASRDVLSTVIREG